VEYSGLVRHAKSTSAWPARLVFLTDDRRRDSETAGPPADPVGWFRKYDMEYPGPSPFRKIPAS
jgi:hypothetical protein